MDTAHVATPRAFGNMTPDPSLSPWSSTTSASNMLAKPMRNIWSRPYPPTIPYRRTGMARYTVGSTSNGTTKSERSNYPSQAMSWPPSTNSNTNSPPDFFMHPHNGPSRNTASNPNSQQWISPYP